MTEDFDDKLAEISESLAEEKDKILYEASKDGAEAVVFTENPVYEGEMEREDGTTFTVTQRYKVCDRVEDVNGLLDLFNIVTIYEIPVYAKRLAQVSETLEEFQEEMEQATSRWRQ